MFKFILGPVGGYASGLNIFVTIIITIAGMMTVVLVFTLSGTWIQQNVLRRFFVKKDASTPKNLKFIVFWKKYGLVGVAALTPIIFTPIGGTILAITSGSPKNKIISYMVISAVFWAIIFSTLIYFFGNEILPDWLKPDPADSIIIPEIFPNR
jgi:membrane protein DedA with SNARE-associated domain